MVLNKKELSKAFSPNKQRKGVFQKRLSGLIYRPKLNAAATSKMKVVIRVRPQNQTEMESNQRCVVKVINKEMLMFDPKEDTLEFFYHGVKQQQRDMLRKQNKELKFDFDCVFDGSSTNGQIFNDTMEGILSSLLDGFNCSVFAYGATGAGKTFTMLGTDAKPGITYLTMVELYRRMAEKASERSFDVNVSYLEVYNENVHDLLKPSNMLLLRDNGSNGVHVAGLEILRINNADDLIELLRKGNLHRTQHPTDANAESSRSHAVFQLHIRMTDKLSKQVKLVKLSMIDLAGSERASATGCRGMRFTEGANINKSLLALGNCINALSDGLKHIPYRDSKLTRLLKDSLGGNCNTVMIANVSPSLRSYEDTYNTLKYASRAKKIKSKLKRNIVASDPYAAQYGQVIEALKLEVAELKQALKESEDGKALLAEQFGNTTAVLPAIDRNVLSAEQEIQLEKFKAEMARCYEVKKSLHMEIMKYDGLLKCAGYHKMMKLDTCYRLKELCFHDRAQLERALQRTYKSLLILGTHITNYNLALQHRWALFGENMNEINALQTQITECGLRSHIDEDIIRHIRELNEMETDKVVVHLLRLSVIEQSQLDGQDVVITEMAKTLASYHAILQGNNLLTNVMQFNYITKIRRMLEGVKHVTWGQSHETVVNLGEILPDDRTAFEIPPKITEYMSLEFSKYKPQVGNPNNISQLNYSKEETSTCSSRYSINMNSAEKFVRQMTGDMKRVDNCQQDIVVRNIGSNQESDLKKVVYDEYKALTPVSMKIYDEDEKDCSISNLILRDRKLDHPPECRSENYFIRDHFSAVSKDNTDFNTTFSPVPTVAKQTRTETPQYWLSMKASSVSEEQMESATTNSREISQTKQAPSDGNSPNQCEIVANEEQIRSAITKNAGNFVRLLNLNKTFANKIQMENATTENVVGTMNQSQNKSNIDKERNLGHLPNLNETFVNENQMEMATTKNVFGIQSQEISKIQQVRNIGRLPILNETFVNEEQIEIAPNENVVGIQSREKLTVKIGPMSNEALQCIVTKVDESPARLIIADNGVFHCQEEPRAKITERISEKPVQHVTKLICKAPEAIVIANNDREGQSQNINANLDCTFVLKNSVETKKSILGKTKFEPKRSTLPNQSPYVKKKCNKENNALTSIPQKDVKRRMEAPAVFLKPSSTINVPRAPQLKMKKEEPQVLEMVHRAPLKPKNELLIGPGSDQKNPINCGKERKLLPITPRQYPYSRQMSQPTLQRPLLKKS